MSALLTVGQVYRQGPGSRRVTVLALTTDGRVQYEDAYLDADERAVRWTSAIAWELDVDAGVLVLDGPAGPGAAPSRQGCLSL